MPTGPRSQRLLFFQSTAASNSPVWVTPQGYTTLIKSMVVTNTGAGQNDVYLAFGTPSATSAMLIEHNNLANGGEILTEFWLVANPGDYLYFICNGAGLNCSLFGAVLEGNPRLQPAEAQSPLVTKPFQSPEQLPTAPARLSQRQAHPLR